MKKIKSLIINSSVITTIIGGSIGTLTSCANFDYKNIQKQLLPTVKEYKNISANSFNFAINSKIFYDAKISGLTDLLCLIQQRLMDAGITFGKIQLVNDSSVIDHSIRVNVANDLVNASSLPDTYAINISSKIIINANGLRGVLYAFNTLMQIYKISDNKIYYGDILDYPDIAERTIHLDCGRKYFTPKWVKNLIVEAAYKKINTIELHFSELSCMRLQLPEGNQFFNLAGARAGFDQRFISAEEMMDIVRFAQIHQIEIIPSLDMPGHARWIIEWYSNNHEGEDITLKNNAGSSVDYPAAIDITNNNARSYIKNLYIEYSQFFHDLGCRKFNIGFDEFIPYERMDSTTSIGYSNTLKQYAIDVLDVPAINATGFDTLNDWMNEIYNLLVEKGYHQVRAFNDQFLYDWSNITPTILPDKNIQVAYWTNSSSGKYATINQLAANGYHLYNLNDDYLYYVLSAGMQKPEPNQIFNDWNLYKFSQTIADLPKAYLPFYKGAYYCIWCDYYTRQTQDLVYQGTFKSIATFAEKTWNLNSIISYEQHINKVYQIGTDIENSNSILPFLTQKDDHIFGPNLIEPANIDFSDGNNTEYFMDDINWNSITKNITWSIVDPDPIFGSNLRIDDNQTTGTTRGTCLVRFPSTSSLIIGNYSFTLKADVIDNTGSITSYMKQIIVAY